MVSKPIQLSLPLPIAKNSNDLARARLKSGTTLGFRVAVLVASMIKKTDEKFKAYEVSSNLLTPYNNGKKDFERMAGDLDGIAGTTVLIQEGTKYRSFPFFQMAEYDTETRKVTVRFNEELKKHLLQLENNFTRIPTGEYMHLSSEYTQKLYVWLLSWDDYSEQSIEIDDLHELLNTPELHRKDFAKLRTKILTPAYKQITSKTCLRYEWEPVIYKGRTTHVRFVFSVKKMAQLNSASYRFKKLTTAKKEKLHKAFLATFKDTPPAILKEWTWLKNRKSNEYRSGFEAYLQETKF